jgi:hypothetical protein
LRLCKQSHLAPHMFSSSFDLIVLFSMSFICTTVASGEAIIPSLVDVSVLLSSSYLALITPVLDQTHSFSFMVCRVKSFMN